MNMIRPVSDLRNNFADISKTVHETAQPVFLTKNGYGDMVVLSMEAFENLQFESEVYFKLQEAERECHCKLCYGRNVHVRRRRLHRRKYHRRYDYFSSSGRNPGYGLPEGLSVCNYRYHRSGGSICRCTKQKKEKLIDP